MLHWGCVDGVSFHGLLRSGSEFRQHLPAVLQIQVLVGRLCIQRTTGRWCRNSDLDRSRPWKLTPSTHPRADQKTWTIRNIYGYSYANICIVSAVSLSNGRRLTRMCHICKCITNTRRGDFMPHLAVLQSDESRWSGGGGSVTGVWWHEE